MKKLSNYLWPHELENLNRLHFDVVLNMLKYPHFNAKMNSLKEVIFPVFFFKLKFVNFLLIKDLQTSRIK
jgi:hypothetical protein